METFCAVVAAMAFGALAIWCMVLHVKVGDMRDDLAGFRALLKDQNARIKTTEGRVSSVEAKVRVPKKRKVHRGSL